MTDREVIARCSALSVVFENKLFTDRYSSSLTPWLPLQVDESVTHNSLRLMLALTVSAARCVYPLVCCIDVQINPRPRHIGPACTPSRMPIGITTHTALSSRHVAVCTSVNQAS